MPYRRLGKSGLLVPVFSIGSWLTVYVGRSGGSAD